MPNTTPSKNRRVDVQAVNDGKIEHLATIRLNNGKIAMEGDQTILEEISHGIVDSLTGNRILPESGDAFLSQVLALYDNPYLFATEVEE